MQLSLLTRSWGNSKRGWHEQGFTLIELIVVTFLIGIMLSVSIPSLRDTFLNDPLKATARKVIGLVNGVRELAVRTQQPYLLHISLLENRIWFEKDVTGEKDKNTETSQERQLSFPESVTITGLWLGGDETSAEGDSVVWISKKGYLNDTIIRIEDDAGNHLNVQFYPFLDPALVSDQATPF